MTRNAKTLCHSPLRCSGGVHLLARTPASPAARQAELYQPFCSAGRPPPEGCAVALDMVTLLESMKEERGLQQRQGCFGQALPAVARAATLRGRPPQSPQRQIRPRLSLGCRGGGGGGSADHGLPLSGTRRPATVPPVLETRHTSRPCKVGERMFECSSPRGHCLVRVKTCAINVIRSKSPCA